ncbi:hypothetical protein Q5752_006514 [Cryptotrichosporon argae]
MPRAVSSPSPEVKPYDRPSSSPSSTPLASPPPFKPRKTPSKTSAKMSTRGTRESPAKQAWTPDEYVALYDHVTAHGKGNWGVAVPGRTANQSKKAWTQTVDQLIRKCLLEKGRK